MRFLTPHLLLQVKLFVSSYSGNKRSDLNISSWHELLSPLALAFRCRIILLNCLALLLIVDFFMYLEHSRILRLGLIFKLCTIISHGLRYLAVS